MAGEGETLRLMTDSALDRMITSLREQVRDEFVTLKSHMVEKPLTKKEAATYLGVTYKTIESRVTSGAIPSEFVHKNGGTVYFFASELNQLLKKS